MDNIDSLGLSVRAMNCLHAERITTIDQLKALTATDLLILPNIGVGTLREIAFALATRGIKLYGFDLINPPQTMTLLGQRSRPRKKTIAIELTYWECMIGEHRHQTSNAATICIRKTIRRQNKCQPANPPK